MKQEDISVNERYPTLDVNNKLIWNIRDIGHTMRQLFEGKGSQKRVLMMLRENPGLTQRALTERLGVQPGSASEVVGKLEAAGLLERETSAEDRRTAVLHLTGAGAQAADMALSQRAERHERMFSCLSEEEKQTLLTLLERVNGFWDQEYRSGEGAAAPHGHGHHGHPHGHPHGHHGHHGGAEEA